MPSILLGLMWPLFVLGAGVLLSAVTSTPAAAEGSGPKVLPAETIGFNTHIRPILMKHCANCHGGPKQAGGVSFLYRDSALAQAESGESPIVPGKPDESQMLVRVASKDDEFRMPPAEHGPPLGEREIELLRTWIEQGARWEEHWSFIPPQVQPLPNVHRSDWCREDLDRFILAKVEAAHLQPSSEATRPEWLRRVTFDLTGLPPTDPELTAFLADDTATAYDKVVDRLLASPKFGERWATLWLDLSRFADTVGFERDPNRSAWPYRDWLIRALNADMPFDEFTVKQLAGDLLPNATLDDRIATAFHRNTQTNTEGGSDDEEFRLAAVLDRANTTWQVWSALTFGCAQCHSHPYDPIRNDEYYKFTAFFNTTQDADLGEDLPTAAVPRDTGQFAKADELDQRIASLRAELRTRAMAVSEKANVWTNIIFDDLRSSGITALKNRKSPDAGFSEVVTVGNISARSQYQLTGPLPSGVKTIRAIKIDALPKNLEDALKIPESGFVLSRFRAELLAPGEKTPIEIEFATAFCDDARPVLDPEDSLRDNWQGFGSFSRIDRPHWVVFIPRRPVAVPNGSRLRLVLTHGRNDPGEGALVIERGRYWVSSAPRWAEVTEGPAFEESLAAIHKLRGEREMIPSTLLPVMAEQTPNERRLSYLFERGNWLVKGAVVEPNIPAALSPTEPISNTPMDRLAMARWLVSGSHPLTARVFVNRIWEQLFGTGIVLTVGDFGASGTVPSHPELLDFLALRFQDEQQWRVKDLLREIVLSATYRQSSRTNSELTAADPSNRLLSRGTRQRLTAEMIRDQALAVSGFLSPRMYGPPVMPPQPEGVWRSVYNGNEWKTSEGEDKYRRALYTFWKRTSGYPSMLTFDAPARDVCSVQRPLTNTPLQALVALNDPVMLDCADGLAKRMVSEGGDSTRLRIEWAYRQATSAEISPSALAVFEKLYNQSLERSAVNFGGSDTADASNEAHIHFSLKIVAHAILNLDEALTR